jgi:hypothetical protein
MQLIQISVLLHQLTFQEHCQIAWCEIKTEAQNLFARPRQYVEHLHSYILYYKCCLTCLKVFVVKLQV